MAYVVPTGDAVQFNLVRPYESDLNPQYGDLYYYGSSGWFTPPFLAPNLINALAADTDGVVSAQLGAQDAGTGTMSPDLAGDISDFVAVFNLTTDDRTLVLAALLAGVTANFDIGVDNPLAETFFISAPNTTAAEFFVSQTDNMNFSAADFVEHISVIVEDLIMTDTPTAQISMLQLIVQEIGLHETAMLIGTVLLTEQIAISEGFSDQHLVFGLAYETLMATGVVMSQAQVVNLLSVAFTISDLAEIGVDAYAVETVQLAGLIANNQVMVESLLASYTLTSSTVGELSVILELSEEVLLTAAGSAQVELTEELLEAVLFDSVFIIGGYPYHAWVMNTEGKRPVSHYPNYPFTSLFRVGDKYLGTSDDGLFELDGDDDNGEAIIAALKTGKLDFGEMQMKNARTLYMGFTSEGRLIVKVTTSQEGVEKERWYELKGSKAGVHREGRIKLGRGIKSRYWQLEIINPEGADFDISELNLQAVQLARRV